MTPPRATPRREAPRQTRTIADRPSETAMLLRRGRKLLRPALAAGGGLVLLLLLWSAVRGDAASASLVSLGDRIGGAVDLRVEHVVVEGRVNTPEPLLRAAIGVTPGEPLFGFSVERARERIKTLSWVDEVSVERRLPGTIVVALTEKRPFAIWQNGGRFQLIDRDGAVVTDEDVGAFGSLPLVVGAGAPQHATAMLELLAGQPGLQNRVVALVRVGERRWNLRLNNGADVLLPEGAEAAALNRLAELQAKDDVLDRPLLAIDMRLPDRLILRPRPGATGEGAPAPTPAAASPGPRSST